MVPLIASNSTGGFVAIVATAAGGLGIGAAPSSIDAGFSVFRNTGLTNVAVAVKATGGNVYGIHAINPGANTAYLKLYNLPAANVNVGNTAPTMVIPIAGSTNLAPGAVRITPDITPLKNFATAIAIAATNGLADSDATVPVGTPYVDAVFYN